MKKKSLFSGISAKLALAAVALAAVVVTSCEKEEFKVEPVEIPNASATIAITVYSLDNGSVLQSSTETVAAGADGTIAAQTKTISAPSIAGYLPGEDVTVAIPALAKGQFALIPAYIYLQSELSAAKNPVVTEDKVQKDTPRFPEPSEYTNDSGKDELRTITYNTIRGQAIVNLDEVYEYIDTYVPATRTFSNADIIAILKALINSYNADFKEDPATATIIIPANTTVRIVPKTSMNNVVCTISTTIEGILYTVPDVHMIKAGATTFEIKSNGHDHGHGGGNSGGGAGGK